MNLFNQLFEQSNVLFIKILSLFCLCLTFTQLRKLWFLVKELDSVRAMFSDKEKELSVAVAKVEELTSQLESLRASTQVLPWPNASSSAAVDSSTLYLQNKIGAESGNNLVFDRMNSQLLVSF